MWSHTFVHLECSASPFGPRPWPPVSPGEIPVTVPTFTHSSRPGSPNIPVMPRRKTGRSQNPSQAGCETLCLFPGERSTRCRAGRPARCSRTVVTWRGACSSLAHPLKGRTNKKTAHPLQLSVLGTSAGPSCPALPREPHRRPFARRPPRLPLFCTFWGDLALPWPSPWRSFHVSSGPHHCGWPVVCIF